MTDLVIGADGLARCGWGSSPDYLTYHDTEWGRPLRGDDALYERMTLEAFQSGLSWLTILRKRENFRAAFDKFKIKSVAAYDDTDVARLMADAGIVRNRAKVDAAIANARAALEVARRAVRPAVVVRAVAPARPAGLGRLRCRRSTPESTAMAKALKKQGFRFVGPTTAYALMQATGMVDDHLAGCHVPPP